MSASLAKVEEIEEEEDQDLLRVDWWGEKLKSSSESCGVGCSVVGNGDAADGLWDWSSRERPPTPVPQAVRGVTIANDRTADAAWFAWAL
jgi:hypothetical protein